jgi:hypothetical protein
VLDPTNSFFGLELRVRRFAKARRACGFTQTSQDERRAERKRERERERESLTSRRWWLVVGVGRNALRRDER